MTNKPYWILAVLLMIGTTGCGEAIGLGLCGAILLVLAIIAVIEVAISFRSLVSKVLWILFILCVPGGVIIYYLFGR